MKSRAKLSLFLIVAALFQVLTFVAEIRAVPIRIKANGVYVLYDFRDGYGTKNLPRDAEWEADVPRDASQEAIREVWWLWHPRYGKYKYADRIKLMFLMINFRHGPEGRYVAPWGVGIINVDKSWPELLVVGVEKSKLQRDGVSYKLLPRITLTKRDFNKARAGKTLVITRTMYYWSD